jgi:hypothetical protein
MTALACQLLEPPGNLIRVGNTEGASQLQRKVAADVKFMNPSGTLNHIAANTPAIPWTSSTGFGSGVTPPTTAATVDLTTFAGRWVTFILAGADGSTRPMYVCQVTDWQAIAGPAGGRTAIPLDLWELHSWRYCGPEFTGEQALPNSGRYTAGGGVAVAASTDATTHGDYGTQHVTFPSAYAAGLVPAVVPASEDAAFVASVSNINNTGFDVTVRRLRPLTDPLSGELDLTIPLGSNAIDALVTYGVTYDAAPVIQLEVVDDPSGADAESSYQASQYDRSTTDFRAVIFHMPHPTPLTTAVASGTSGTPSPNTSGNNANQTTGMGDPSTLTGAGGTAATGAGSTGHVHQENTAATYTQNANTAGAGAAHTHTGPSHTHVTGDHTHSMNNHSHDLASHTHALTGHTHTVDVFPNEAAARTLRVGWTAFGRRSAAATTVPVSWIARG